MKKEFIISCNASCKMKIVQILYFCLPKFYLYLPYDHIIFYNILLDPSVE